MTPFVQVNVGGANILDGLQGRLISVKVKDQSGSKNDTVTIVIDDRAPPVSYPPVGTKVSVVMGYAFVPGAEAKYNGRQRLLGEFTIDEVKFDIGPDKITVTGHAIDTENKFKGHKNKDHHQKTLKDIFSKIASNAGLTLKMGSDIGSTKIEHVDQAGQSDMDFGMRLARRYNAVMKVAQGNLYVNKRGSDTTISGKQVQTIVIDKSDCTTGSGTLQKRSKHTGVKGRYHDTDEAEEKEELAGEEGTVKVLPFKYPTKEEAKAAATAEKETLDREGESLSITVIGHPEIAAEARLLLTGFRPGMRTSWLVSEVSHDFDGESYTCEIEGEIPDSKSKDNDAGTKSRDDGDDGSKEE